MDAFDPTRPSTCFLPTASADGEGEILWFYRQCAPLNVHPHYDVEPRRRPLYQQLIGSGEMKPGCACDEDAGIHFQFGRVARVVTSRAGARCCHARLADVMVVERTMEPEMLA